MQQPTSAYQVEGNIITFTETPLTSDIIEVRAITVSVRTITAISDGTTRVETSASTGDIRFFNSDIETIRLTSTGAMVAAYPLMTIPNSASPIAIDSYNSTVYRTAHYTIQATSQTNFESYEVLLTHNGTASFIKVIGSINTGTILGNVTTSLTGTTVSLLYTSLNSNTSIRLSKNYIFV